MPEAPDPLSHPAVSAAFGAIGVLLAATLVRELPRIPKQLLVLMASAFLDMVGLFLIVPLLPFYVMKFAHGTELPVLGKLGEGTLIGIVVSSYTIAQLLSAPLWGRMSDRLGRRPVLIVALFASAVAYVIFAFADSLWLLLLSRIVQGAGGGTVGVIQAYVADSVEPSQRARGLGWLSAATNLGVAFGPVIGSLLVAAGELDLWPGDASLSLGSAAPGIGAAVLCLLNIAFAAKYLPESRQAAPAAAAAAPTSARKAAWQVVVRFAEPAPRLIWIYAIAIGSFQGIMPMLAPYLHDRFSVTEKSIGYVFMWIGAVSVWARVLLLGRLVDRFGEVKVARIGVVVLVGGLLGMAQADSLPLLAVTVALLPLGAALTFPCVTALLSQTVGQTNRGLWMGLQQSFGGASRIVAPLVYGLTFDGLGKTVPFHVAAALVLSTLLLAAGLGAAQGGASRDILPPATKEDS